MAKYLLIAYKLLQKFKKIVRNEQRIGIMSVLICIIVERKYEVEGRSMDNYDLKEGFTHGGIFHADDVFSTALLEILNPDIKIYRGFTVPKDFTGIVYDVGRGVFDHHQNDKKIRENGVPYAAFGLLWEVYGARILGDENAKRFDEEFIQPLDLADNTGSKNMLSQIIADKNSCWNEKQEVTSDRNFFEAVQLAKEILKNRFRQILAAQEAYATVRKLAEKNRGQILYLEPVMPWKEAVKGLDIVYVIYASNRGGYCIQAVPEDEEALMLKKPFPEKWRGLTSEELQKITGIKGFLFCHGSGFLCSAENLEQAEVIAETALKEQ